MTRAQAQVDSAHRRALGAIELERRPGRLLDAAPRSLAPDVFGDGSHAPRAAGVVLRRGVVLDASFAFLSPDARAGRRRADGPARARGLSRASEAAADVCDSGCAPGDRRPLAPLHDGPAAGAYAVPGFMLSGGVGFALVHLVLRLRRVVGVYPPGRSRKPPRLRLARGRGESRFPMRSARTGGHSSESRCFRPPPFSAASSCPSRSSTCPTVLRVGLLARGPTCRAARVLLLAGSRRVCGSGGGVLAFILLEILHLLGSSIHEKRMVIQLSCEARP